ncbi:cutinase family protein [Mycobacterium xenopi 3993]|nr:cutinase family protein [Mycobacterium xenopi 3993]
MSAWSESSLSIRCARRSVGGPSRCTRSTTPPPTITPLGERRANDASAHVRATAANCPNTKIVLGGYSQGALVIDLITIAQAPVAGFVPDSLPQDTADHVAAVATFGNPSDRYLGRRLARSARGMGPRPLTCARTEIRFARRASCATVTRGIVFPAHLSYAHSGMPGQAAAFVAGRL